MYTSPAMAAALLAAAALWAADTRPVPAHQREPAKAAPASSSKAPARPAMTDAQIEAAIRGKFARSKINADKFQVHVQGGVATIEGRTDVIQHKGTATRMAKTGGAQVVNNRIQISDAARKKAAGNLEEGRRRAQIKRGDARSELRPPSQAR